MKSRALIPDAIRLVNIFGALYFIHWEDLPRWGSFFLPTTASAAQVKTALQPAADYFDFTFEVRTRCENGLYGARVWRTG